MYVYRSDEYRFAVVVVVVVVTVIRYLNYFWQVGTLLL